MIGKAVEALKNELDGHLARMPDLTIESAAKVIPSNFTKEDGAIALPKDVLGLTLVNIEEERVLKSSSPAIERRDGKLLYGSPEIRLNLYLLFCANFKDYVTGLKYLSAVVGFFQHKHVFTQEDTPGLGPGIERLVAELYTLNLEQLNHLWGYLGGKYCPSVLYKLGLVRIQTAMPQFEASPVHNLDILGGGRS